MGTSRLNNWIRRLAMLPPLDVRCSFCGLPHAQAGPFAEGPNQAFICEPCVAACAALIGHEKVRRTTDSGTTNNRTMYLSAARIFVRDLKEAKDFYSSKLGFPLVLDGGADNYLVFIAGTVHLVIEPQEVELPSQRPAINERFTGLSFAVASAKDTHKELSSVGVCFTGEPERQAWGGIIATFKDPTGNQMQIVEHPAEAQLPNEPPNNRFNPTCAAFGPGL